MGSIYNLVEKAHKALLSDDCEREAEFIGHMPFELVKTAYGDCETVDEVIEMTTAILDVKSMINEFLSSRR